MLDWRGEKFVIFAPNGLRPIPYARNFCVKAFLQTDCTHLWFVDGDTIPPPKAPYQMLGAEKDAISGVVHVMKVDDDGMQKPAPMVLRRNRDGDLKVAIGEGVEPIAAAGSGCIMFTRRVFKTIDFPWYEDRPWGEVRGSDFLFCEKLQSQKIQLYAHFDVVCLHRKEVEY
jgi:hypothetical protein